MARYMYASIAVNNHSMCKRNARSYAFQFILAKSLRPRQEACLNGDVTLLQNLLRKRNAQVADTCVLGMTGHTLELLEIAAIHLTNL